MEKSSKNSFVQIWLYASHFSEYYGLVVCVGRKFVIFSCFAFFTIFVVHLSPNLSFSSQNIEYLTRIVFNTSP